MRLKSHGLNKKIGRLSDITLNGVSVVSAHHKRHEHDFVPIAPKLV